MDFGMEPLPPMKLGVEPEYYESVLDSYNFSEGSFGPSLSGELEIDGELRYLKFSLQENKVVQIELCDITPEDTFCGVPMNHRAKKFQKLLKEAGVGAVLDEDGIDLEDHKVGFFVDGGKPASICWG